MDLLKCWSSPYELIPRDPSSHRRRTGALLKFEFPEVGVGYADLHPWVEFGEPALADHLISLQSKGNKLSRLTPLTERAVQNAFIDAQYRQKKQSFLTGVEQVTNNALLLDILDETVSGHPSRTRDLAGYLNGLEHEGFTHLKIKVGQDSSREVLVVKQILNTSKLLLRLDANAKFTYDEAHSFLLQLTPEERTKIEYFEDPCPFDQKDWAHLRALVPIALDWQAEAALAKQLPSNCWDVVVVKPSRSDLNFWIKQAQKHQTKITITSAMDHPLGVLMALGFAHKLQQEFQNLSMVAGCQTIELYQSDDFSARIKRIGPRMNLVDQETSYGLGFTALLESQKWK